MKYIYSFFLLLIGLSINAQVTYADDIAPLIYENCSNCHRSGEIGPFTLTNYEEVSNWGQMIKFVTQERYMPPWKPDPNYSHFLDETFLSQDEIDMIAEWVDGGMERGDVANEPAFPEYPEGSLLGEPDLVLKMREVHVHRGNNRDSYYYFVLPTGLTEDKIVKTMEFRPGNPAIVHHALIFEDVNGIARATDAQTSEYGFESFGSFNGNENDVTFLEGKQFAPYAPGQKTVRFPDGIGQVLQAGADLAVQIHYAPSSVDEMDQSSINIFFADADEEVDRYVDHDIFLPNRLPGGFFGFRIQPEQIKEFTGSWTIQQDRSLVGIFPHSHLLGKEWEAWIEHTDGSRTNLISIPDWNFNWQSQYYFDRLIKAEQGSKIIARALYDNTSNNPFNPNVPPRAVFWGDRTQDEMYYMPFLFVSYRDGDEDIVFGSTAVEDLESDEPISSRIYPINPNPVDDLAHANFYLTKGQTLEIKLMDINGQTLRILRRGEFYNSGLSYIDFRTGILDSGTYVLSITGKDIQLSQKFVKMP